MQQDVAGKKAPALWPSHLGIVGGWCLCLESSYLATFLLGGLLVLCSLKALREALSPFHLLWCWLLPPASGAASASVGRQLSRPAWREGTPPVLSQLCSGEGPVVPLACPGGQLPRSQIAGIPAEQALLSVADPTLLLSPAGPARLPLSLHPARVANSTDPVTSVRPGPGPFPRGLPTVFHNPQLCPDPSAILCS